MRPWIAIAAAFGFVLQVLLATVLVGEFDASAASDNPFAICLGSGAAPSDHGAPADAPVKHPPCVLCLLAKSAHVLLPTATASAKLGVKLHAIVGPTPVARITRYDSPTGHYQRGPPARALAG
jgi:hypothetical protein